jgi:predicted 3-demethylubiquinone-9 3-methyltransferase (glyoxalase superfamily)
MENNITYAKNTPFLWFDNQGEEAANFYEAYEQR